MRTVQVTPSASILVESMRDIGYSLETALADVIDNAITASASTVHILVEPDDPGFRIGILDDGAGMGAEELLVAMRPGSRNPLDERGRSDLGRFGLGLKTASFSQCRRLTVVTRRYGATSAAVWDLDRVAETDDWVVEIPDDPSSLPWVERLGQQGTLVVWERLDRLVHEVGTASSSNYFARRMDEAREHLEMVFHRFLTGEKDLKRIRMAMNGVPLTPFDPFHSRHPATIVEPSTPEVIQVGGERVLVQTFTLPHHRKVSAEEWERYAGRAGYLRNQGFYLYRGRRLIIHGTWFGLARQTELTKLARVKIDMPNGLDAEWKIDVKKASAQLPPGVRERLRRIIEPMLSTSRRVYTSRGKRLTDENRLPVWNRIQSNNEIAYRINPEHPVLQDFMKRIPGELTADFLRVIDFTSSALPMDALFADLIGEPESVGGGRMEDDAMRQILVTTVNQLLEAGVRTKEVATYLRHADPFRSDWARTETMLGALGLETSE